MILKLVVFMGSARNVVPPWGGDARLGTRVMNHVKTVLDSHAGKLGEDTIKYDYKVVDPIEVFGPGGALAEISSGQLTAPTFMLNELPEGAATLKRTIEDADCYLIVSPEYNHSVPPALSSLMDHFGASCYKGKVAGIVTYSAGPWGGMRAAMGIQLLCHELGCLPVSQLCGFPLASTLFHEDGTPQDVNHRMLKQLPMVLEQLDWAAVAFKRQRELTGVFK